MASRLKQILRKTLRFYLTYTPVKKGRYPLMMAVHKYLSEPVTEQVLTSDRGIMVLDLDDWIQYTMYYNMFEAKYLKTIKSLVENTNIVFDIGGSVGQHALLFANYARHVYTFEPFPRLIERLKLEVGLNHLENKITVVPYAASDKEGVIPFQFPVEGSNLGIATTILGRKENINTIEVRSIRIDNYLADVNPSDLDFVKLDIEGGELYALRGMSGLLDRGARPIFIMEINDLMMGHAGYTASDIVNYLGQYGYTPYEVNYKGLSGPADPSASNSENYCFLTPEHLRLPKVRRVLTK
jgi:FkbM family methyltransferase